MFITRQASASVCRRLLVARQGGISSKGFASLNDTPNTGGGFTRRVNTNWLETHCNASPPPPAPVATYEEVLALPQQPDILLVDVREPQELLDTGIIPTSINVPLADVASAFSPATSPAIFRQRYGRDKPAADVPLIFACRIGRRSEAAAQTAIELGFKNVKNYRGSWLDWAERNGLPQ